MTTIEELKAMRVKLVERRMKEVFWITDFDDARLAAIANIQITLTAIDAVINQGDVPPEDELTSAFL